MWGRAIDRVNALPAKCGFKYVDGSHCSRPRGHVEKHVETDTPSPGANPNKINFDPGADGPPVIRD